MQSTNVQSTTGNLPVGKRHYGQRTSWQRPIGLNTTGKWMLGKMLRGQYDWQANYDRPRTSYAYLDTVSSYHFNFPQGQVRLTK